MSKRLERAIADGKVVVQNKTPGEANVMLPGDTGAQRRSVLVGGYATTEIAPKHIEASRLRSSNIKQLVDRGVLVVL